MNELWIKFNPKTHKPKYIGIAKPAKNCEECEFKGGICKQQANKCEHGSRLTTIYGTIRSIAIPIPDEEEEKQ